MKQATRYRSAITGLYTSKEFADQNPNTTVAESVYIPLELKSTRVKESLAYLLDTLKDKATEEEINDLEQLKLLV